MADRPPPASTKGGTGSSTDRGSLDALEPLRSASTASLIAERIRAAIMGGSLVPGAQLGEAELGARLQVSRGPVREALQRLVQEGVLVAYRNRGVFVPRLDHRDVADVYLARTAIETAAAMAVIERGATAVDAVQRALAGMESAVAAAQWPDVTRLDLEFHQALVAASGSQRLERMFGTLLVESRLCLSGLGDAYRAPAGVAVDHRHLFEAVQRCDRQDASQRIADHMQDAAHRLGDLFGQHGQDVRDGGHRGRPAAFPEAGRHVRGAVPQRF